MKTAELVDWVDCTAVCIDHKIVPKPQGINCTDWENFWRGELEAVKWRMGADIIGGVSMDDAEVCGITLHRTRLNAGDWFVLWTKWREQGMDSFRAPHKVCGAEVMQQLRGKHP